jgi:hypothetical protein
MSLPSNFSTRETPGGLRCVDAGQICLDLGLHEKYISNNAQTGIDHIVSFDSCRPDHLLDPLGESHNWLHRNGMTKNYTN